MSPPYFFVGFHFGRFASSKGDGSVKSPISALCCILAQLNSRFARRRSRFNRASHCGVRKVRLIPQDLHAPAQSPGSAT